MIIQFKPKSSENSHFVVQNSQTERISITPRLMDQNWPTDLPNRINFSKFRMISGLSYGLVIRWVKHYAILIHLIKNTEWSECPLLLDEIPLLHPLTFPQPVRPHMVPRTQFALIRHGVDQRRFLAEVELAPGVL